MLDAWDECMCCVCVWSDIVNVFERVGKNECVSECVSECVLECVCMCVLCVELTIGMFKEDGYVLGLHIFVESNLRQQ